MDWVSFWEQVISNYPLYTSNSEYCRFYTETLIPEVSIQQITMPTHKATIILAPNAQCYSSISTPTPCTVYTKNMHISLMATDPTVLAHNYGMYITSDVVT